MFRSDVLNLSEFQVVAYDFLKALQLLKLTHELSFMSEHCFYIFGQNSAVSVGK